MNVPASTKYRVETTVRFCPVLNRLWFMGIAMSAVLLTFDGAIASAQVRSNSVASAAMSAIYGRGVHAYFAGDLAQAEQYFTQVIQAGSTDPRPYYFRGVLRWNAGRQAEAEFDMRVGAAYEARNPGVSHSIGRALQRVQGPTRRILEKYRRQGKLERVQKGLQQTRQRYEQLEQRGPAVLRTPAPVPLDQSVQPPRDLAGPDPGPSLAPDTKAPETPAAPTAPAPAAEPQAPAAAEAATEPPPASPEMKSAEPENKATADDPFGAPAPAKPAEDPFGVPTPADEPFGTAPSAAPSADSSSTEVPAPAASDAGDPFGEETSAAEEESMEDAGEAPADTDASDPFGDSLFSEEEASAEEASTDAETPADEPASEDDAPADESDPFAEPSSSAEEMAEEEAADDSTDEAEPAEEEAEAGDEEDDPFDPFGATTIQPGSTSTSELANTGSASSALAADPAGQLFFALGQWIGSGGGQLAAPTEKSMASRPGDNVTPAGFEFGPSEFQPTATANKAVATEEVFTEEDPFGAPPETTTSDNPTEDPFGGEDPFGDP